MRSVTSFLSLCLFTGFTLATETATTDLPVTHLSSVIDAEPLARKSPKFPVNAARRGKEGWVQISFVVDENGQVIEPYVVDSEGGRAFETQALNAVKKWRYKPAEQNGKKIQQCDNKVQLDFMLEGQQGVTKSYKRKYKKAVGAFKNGQIGQAQTTITELLGKDKWNHYERIMTYYLEANLARVQKEEERYLYALRKVTGSERNAKYLGAEAYLEALYERFILEIQSGKYQAALSIFEQVEAKKNGEEIAKKMAVHAENVRRFISSDEQMLQVGKIVEDKKWHHQLSRSKFAFANIQGELEAVELRCKNKREIYTVAEETIWSIPEKWGSCTLFVSGENNTRFELLELPQNAV